MFVLFHRILVVRHPLPPPPSKSNEQIGSEFSFPARKSNERAHSLRTAGGGGEGVCDGKVLLYLPQPRLMIRRACAPVFLPTSQAFMVRDRIQMRSHFERVRDASRVRQYTERWFKFSSDPPDEIRYMVYVLYERCKTKAEGVFIASAVTLERNALLGL